MSADTPLPIAVMGYRHVICILGDMHAANLQTGTLVNPEPTDTEKQTVMVCALCRHNAPVVTVTVTIRTGETVDVFSNVILCPQCYVTLSRHREDVTLA